MAVGGVTQQFLAKMSGARGRNESDWNWLGHLGDEWLTAFHYEFKNEAHRVEVARATGYARAIWEESNARPGKIKRVTQAVHSGEIESVTEYDDYTSRVNRWTRARDSWLADYVLTEFKLRPTPQVEPPKIDTEVEALAYTNKLLDRVRGKHLPEYQLPGTGIGTEPVRKKRRQGGKGRPWSTTHQPKR